MEQIDPAMHAPRIDIELPASPVDKPSSHKPRRPRPVDNCVMTQMPPTTTTPDIVLPDEPGVTTVEVTVKGTVVTEQRVFDPDSTAHFHTKMKRAPVWVASMVASNQRETRRFREELAHIKGAWPLLMKQRKGGTWSPEDKVQLKAMVRSASSVSPYLFIWAIPGSMMMLPILAWFLDRRRKKRAVERRLIKEQAGAD